MAKPIEPMTTGPIWKRLTFFALPILLGNLFQQMYNAVDSLIVGNFLGSNALAAVSSSASLIYMMVGFLSGLATGAGVVVSNFYGANNEKGVEKGVHTTVAGGLIAGAVMTVLWVPLTPAILRWMGTPEEVMPESVTYLMIYFAGSMANVMYNVFMGILQAVGDSRHPLYYLIYSSVLNLILDVLFIAVIHTGVGGAALATIISQSVSALLCMRRLMREKECYRLELKKIRIHKDVIGQVINIGLPSGVSNSIIAFANVVVQSYVNAFGPSAMAGIGAFSKIEGFAFLPIQSFMLALTTFVSQNLGAQEYDRAKRGARFGIMTTVISAEAIGLLVFYFAPQLISAFDSNPEVVAFGVDKARVSCIFFFVLAYTHAVSSVLRGAGKAMIPMFVMLGCWCVIRVAFLAVTVPLTHDVRMLYWVYPLTWSLSSILFFFYYKFAHWLPEEAKS